MGDQAGSLKLVHITTVPMTLGFLGGHVEDLKGRGVDVHAVSSPGPELTDFGDRLGIPVHPVVMSRRITPWRDLVALVALCRLLARLRPDVVHAHTPKGGLLGMLAARLVGVRVRVYQIHGLPFVTATGSRRLVSIWAERVSCRLALRVLCVSRSIREVAVASGLCKPGKLRVLGNGSIAGVDALGHFDPARVGLSGRLRIRDEMAIPADSTVVGFVGRLCREKGIGELASAWRVLRDRYPSAHLLLVGQADTEDSRPTPVMEALRLDRRVRLAGLRPDVAGFLAAMDIFAMPTHREGFGVANIEAAAMALPVVSTRIPGCVDSVVDGETGTLVPALNAEALAGAIGRYLDEPGLASQHGRAGRDRVLRDFRPGPLLEAMFQEYSDLLVGRRTSAQSGWKLAVKRSFDVAASALGLLTMAPLLATIALVIRLAMGGPVLFRQARPGFRGVPFELVKFRTMLEAVGPDGAPRPDAERLTRLGWFLRRSSLDELPQLWNVLRGELCLVGPRPLLMEYLPLYTLEQGRRHQVRPGITGWAQVNGRNAIGWDEKFRLDVWYVDHWSLSLDMRILCMTIAKVIRGAGSSHPGVATMPVFEGSEVKDVVGV